MLSTCNPLLVLQTCFDSALSWAALVSQIHFISSPEYLTGDASSPRLALTGYSDFRSRHLCLKLLVPVHPRFTLQQALSDGPQEAPDVAG